MRKIIVANWKMNPETGREARELFLKIKRRAIRLSGVRTVICPPAIFLPLLARPGAVALGGQDGFWDSAGPYTGELSPTMLRYAGARYVILGHSERRALGETDIVIKRKVKAALQAGLRVILCVGERERDQGGKYLRVMEEQLLGALAGLPRKWAAGLFVAYEPVWAIGIKAVMDDTPAGFLEQALFIKKVTSGIFGKEAALRLPVLYGGSVDSKNAAGFLGQGEAAGLLVGRASLEAEEFLAILEAADNPS